MKKFICLVGLLSMVSISSFAQTEKGTCMVGISGNGSFKGTDYRKETNLQISPQIGYFVFKNLAIGGLFALDHDQTIIEEQLTDKSTNTGIYGMARYYVGSRKIRPYANFMAGYTWNRVHVLNPSIQLVKFKADEGENASIGAGLAYFIAPKVALEADVNYRFHFRDEWVKKNRNAVTLRLGLSVYLR